MTTAANDNTKKGQPTVTVYSTPTCHFCHMAKDFFTAHDVVFTDYNVATDLDKRREMVQRSGQMGVPVIYVGDKMIVGFDEEQLTQLLGLGGSTTKMAA
jgi:glutaredoxin 3